MSDIIQNKIVLITGRPGKGKTYLAAFMASTYSRIYSNVNILDSNGNPISNYIENISDVQAIKFAPEKGVIILDEGGVNVNARASQSKENKIYGELGMLGRKLNVDIIIIGQLKRMIDVYYRELANYIFEMNSWFEKKDYLMFEARIFSNGGETIVKVARFDLFEWSRLTGFSYNTLENSRIETKKVEKKEKLKKISIVEENEKREMRLRNLHDDGLFDKTKPLYSTEADEMIRGTAIF